MPGPRRRQKKEAGVEHDGQRPDGRVLKADDEGEQQDAEHVVDDRGTENGGAHLALELAHFPESFHRDAHRGGGDDGADEHRLEEGVRADGAEAVQAGVEQKSPGERDHDAHRRDEQGDRPGPLHFLEIGFQPRDEHEHDDAELRHLREEIARIDQVQDVRADQQAGDNFTDNLGDMDFAHQQSKGFGGDDDHGQIQEKIDIQRRGPLSFMGILHSQFLHIYRKPHMEENQGKFRPNFYHHPAVFLWCLLRDSGRMAAAYGLELPIVLAFPHRLPAESRHGHPLLLLKEPGKVLGAGKADPHGDLFHLQFGETEIEADLFQPQLLDILIIGHALIGLEPAFHLFFVSAEMLADRLEREITVEMGLDILQHFLQFLAFLLRPALHLHLGRLHAVFVILIFQHPDDIHEIGAGPAGPIPVARLAISYAQLRAQRMSRRIISSLTEMRLHVKSSERKGRS